MTGAGGSPATVTDKVSVVICAYTLGRWAELQRAVASVLDQVTPAEEIVVVVDHNAELLARCRSRWVVGADGQGPRVVIETNKHRRGLSGARNTGVRAARFDIVAFLDDDAEADPHWIRYLLASYAEPRVLACGGRAVPVLAGNRPNWWPVEFDWVVGCSYLGLPTETCAVRNLIGANMSARRFAVLELGGFAEGIGRVGARPTGCEETDFFIRLGQRWPDGLVIYEPLAEVRHNVPRDRLSWRYFTKRCYAEGQSKAKVALRVGSDHALACERHYARRVLPRGVVADLNRAVRGEAGAARQAMAMAAGLLITAAGYIEGRVAACSFSWSPPDCSPVSVALG